jgi:spermidine synthase
VSTTPTSPAAPLVAATRIVPALFTLTIFTSAALLFFVQPLFTRIALPQIGGAPAVWTTAMLFFQTALIAGYVYAHVLVRHVPQRIGLAVHLTLWAAALLFLPLALPEGWRYDPAGSAAWQTLVLYAAGVGLPFAFLSANAPLIQAWYARSGGPSASDPYFLYGASNLGSLAALLAFPLAAEPILGLTEIGRAWAWGFAALGVLLLMAGMAARGGSVLAENAAKQAPEAAPGAARIAAWLFLAFVPSSLMLGVTSKISTDFGALPLIWVVPLALYLLTFVLVFTRRPLIGGRGLQAAFVVALVYLVLATSSPIEPKLKLGPMILLVVAFFAVALTSHARLYALRPGGRHLTLFYVAMSVGGALGGLFNSILAPVIFDDIHELKVVIVMAAALLVVPEGRRQALGVAGAVALAVAVLGTLLTWPSAAPAVLAVAACVWAGFALRAGRAATTVLSVGLVAATGAWMAMEEAVLKDRSFFGAHTVQNRDGWARVYAHGTTVHGAQRLDSLGEDRPTPITYYHESGPLGQVLSSPVGQAARSVGIVGLGVGALACYRRPGQDWHFYEIDRKVDEIARDPSLFTYMSSCAGDAPTHLGDARVVLAAQDGLRFDVLVIDAYSSDAVPVHLTTIEAIELYRARLAEGGIALFHVSNNYFDIQLPLGRAAAQLGMAARWQKHFPDASDTSGATASVVVALAADDATLAPLDADGRWLPLPSDGGRVWTDDYANVLGILR